VTRTRRAKDLDTPHDRTNPRATESGSGLTRDGCCSRCVASLRALSPLLATRPPSVPSTTPQAPALPRSRSRATYAATRVVGVYAFSLVLSLFLSLERLLQAVFLLSLFSLGARPHTPAPSKTSSNFCAFINYASILIEYMRRRSRWSPNEDSKRRMYRLCYLIFQQVARSLSRAIISSN